MFSDGLAKVGLALEAVETLAVELESGFNIVLDLEVAFAVVAVGHGGKTSNLFFWGIIVQTKFHSSKK